MTTKNKIFLYVSLIFFIFISILMGAIYINQKDKLIETQSAFYSKIQHSYQKIVSKQTEFYYNRIEANTRSEGVLEAFSSHDRDELYALSKGRWETLKKENKYLKIMHFHLPNGTSFLRMHEPNHFGDPIAQSRPMIEAVHKTHNGISGFEYGQKGLGFRIASPIFNNGTYSGALEFGLSPEQFLIDMEFVSEVKGALFVKASKGSLFSLQATTLNDDQLLQELTVFVPRSDGMKIISVNNNTYTICPINLYSFDHKMIAKMIFVEDITHLQDEFVQTIWKLLGLVLLLFVWMLLLINIGFEKMVMTLEYTNIQLSKNQSFLQSIVKHSSHAIITTDRNGLITLFNRAAEILLGYREDEMVGKQSPAIFHDPQEIIDRAHELSKRFVKKVQPGFNVFVEKTVQGVENNDYWTYITKSGQRKTVHLHISALIDHEGNTNGFLGIAEDVTEAKALEQEMNEYIRLIDENVITSSTDLNGRITYASKAFCEISGYTKEELLGKNHCIVRHPDMDDTVFKEIWETITTDGIWQGEIKNKTKNGGYYWVYSRIYPIYKPSGERYGYTAIRQNITDKKIIEEIAIHDGLTGIYNRRYFNEQFPKMIQSAKRSGDLLAFILLDVDHFKQYNDTYGHQMGDQILVGVSEALTQKLQRSDDRCFRLGGEEFGILFKPITEQKALEFADDLRRHIENLGIEHTRNSAASVVTVSMGLMVILPTDNASCESIYKRTDDFLYKAKNEGRNRICILNE